MRERWGAAIGVSAGSLAALLFVALLFHVSHAGALPQAEGGRSFMGVASCAGSTCHGRSEANGKIVRQDELMLWQSASSPTGAHSRAWRVLTEPRGKAIAGRLGLGNAGTAAM
jgi:hypothetical protein